MRELGYVILFALLLTPFGAIGGFYLFRLVPAEARTEAAAVIPILGGLAGAFLGFIIGGLVGGILANRTQD